MQLSIKHNILLLTLFFLSTTIIAQNKTITGTVYDLDTKKPVEYCNVILVSGNDGTLTDKNGNFNIALTETSRKTKLIFKTFGYRADTLQVIPKQNHYEVFLKHEGIELESVVITGVTRATLIRENPIPISAISTKEIETTSESNVIDALVKNVPGLTAVKTGPNISKPFIHGLGYNRVLTLYAGIRQEGQQYGDEHGLEIDDYSIEKIEVVKGPTSLLYGSDALAGVISIFPHIPSENDGKIHGKFISEYHTNNNLIGNGLRINYSDNKFLFALRGSYRMAKNYRNPVDGRVYLTNFNVSNFSTTTGYKSRNGYTHLNFTYYNNHQGIPDGSRDSLSRAFTKKKFDDDDDDIRNRPIVTDKELNTYKIPDLSQHIQHYRLFLESFYELGNGNIDISLGGQKSIRREYDNPEMPTEKGMYMRLNTLNYGFRYNAPKFANTEISIGINGMLQDNLNKDATEFPIPDYQLYDAGLYIYAKWKKNNWTLSGGLRDDVRYVNWDDFYVGIDPITGSEHKVTNGDISSADHQFEAFSNLYHGLSGSIGTTYKVNNHINLKANIGRAYRSPNLAEIGSNGLDPGARIIYIGDRTFKPEFSLQEDFGVNIRYPNFSTEINIFNNNISNFIYMETLADELDNPILDAQGNRTYHFKQASAHLYGTDISFVVHPTRLKGFRWTNNLSATYGFNRNSEYKNKGVDGEYLPLIPPLTIMSSLSYEIKPKHKYIKSIQPKLEAEYAAKQDRYLGLSGTETFTPSFMLFNIGLTTDVRYNKNYNITLILQANNLFNTAYQSHLNRLKHFEYYNHSPNGHYGVYNMGRNISLRAIVPF